MEGRQVGHNNPHSELLLCALAPKFVGAQTIGQKPYISLL